MGTQELRSIRYCAKIDAEGETSYCGGGWAHFGSAESLGRVLRTNVQETPDVQLVNGPEPDWNKKHHSDGLGEYRLRPLTQTEESDLLSALESAA